MEKFKLKYEKPVKASVRILTPTNIGTGEVINRAELAFGDDILNNQKFNFAYRSSIEKLSRLQNTKIMELLQQRALDPEEPIVELEEHVKRHYEYRIFSLIKDPQTICEYYETIKTSGKVYLPGSSIKGAMLSAVINRAIEECISSSDDYYEYIEKIISESGKKKYLQNKANAELLTLGKLWLKYGDELTQEIPSKELGRHKGVSFEPWITISDTSLISPEDECVLYKIDRVRKQKRESKNHKITDIYIETLRQREEPKFTLSVASNAHHINIRKILKVVDTHYRELFRNEQNWFKRNEIDVAKPEIKKSEILLRVGRGSGLDATSIASTIRTHDENLAEMYGKNWKLTFSQKPEAQTKQVAVTPSNPPEYYPLGWVALTLES